MSIVLSSRTTARVVHSIRRVKMSTLNERPYYEEFNSKEYLNSFFGSLEGNPHLKGRFTWRWEQTYKFFTRYSCKWDNKIARLLEFGGGPAIAPLISVAPYVDQITFSAYLESERKEVELWKHGREGAHNWSSHFKYVVNEVESIAGDDAWREREDLLRRRITSIVPCDALCDNPLLSRQELHELVSTSLCLEAACTTYAQYKEVVKKMIGLLKPGGFFMIVSPECATYYKFGGKKWPCLYVTLENVKEALAEAGTTVIATERDPASMEQIQNPVASDSKAFIFVAAQKVKF